MKTSTTPAASPQRLIGAVAIGMAAAAAQAAPVFSATYDVSVLQVRLDWSSDLGIDFVDESTNFRATGAPITQSAIATRDGRTISASITQTAPYVLADAYWAASWTGSMDVPGWSDPRWRLGRVNPPAEVRGVGGGCNSSPPGLLRSCKTSPTIRSLFTRGGHHAQIVP